MKLTKQFFKEYPTDTFSIAQVAHLSIMLYKWNELDDMLKQAANQREFINLKLLIFGRMGIIISPLFKRYISADKVDQPAILLIELVDDFK